MLITALSIATIVTAAFAFVSQVGTTAVLGGSALFVLLWGIGLSTAIAAIPPTAQAYFADCPNPPE